VLLELPATARLTALQGAGAALVGDEGSIFVNPAGMAPIRHAAMGLSYERSLLGSRLSTGAAALRVGRFHAGFGFMYLDLGGDSVYVPDPALGGDRGIATGDLITAYSALAVGAMSYRRGMLSFGGSVKYLHERVGSGLGSYSAHGLTGSAGMAIAFFDIMAIGVVRENIGGHLTDNAGMRSALPGTTRIGFTINIIDPQGAQRLLTTLDWVHPPGGNSYAAYGLEAGMVAGGVGLIGRAGLASGRAASDRKPWSVGAGIVLRSLQVDYAYQGYDALGTASHRFGVRWVP